jgi:preprotein translocase subunit SecD
MAVDANVIIFERIKEELKMGKTARNALKSGFSRAFTAIFDSNITTIIAALVLWYFGSGPIQGFAVTLFIGVVLSMVSAVVLSQSLLRSFIDLGCKNPKLFGA